MALVPTLLHDDNGCVLVRLQPPPSRHTNPTHGAYAFVIDVSGSMGSEAQLQTTDGDAISNGWSVLDIAKHALLTVIACLDAEDEVALVTYSNSARLVLPPASS